MSDRSPRYDGIDANDHKIGYEHNKWIVAWKYGKHIKHKWFKRDILLLFKKILDNYKKHVGKLMISKTVNKTTLVYYKQFVGIKI